MWRRLSTHLRTLTPARSAPKPYPHIAGNICASPSPFCLTVSLSSRHFTTPSADNVVSKKKVEDVMPITTGHEREELHAELEESPAVVKSYYDKRIVGCPGVEGEDEHDVVWFWLEKGKPHECPVCSQYFVLEVVGPGGPPESRWAWR